MKYRLSTLVLSLLLPFCLNATVSGGVIGPGIHGSAADNSPSVAAVQAFLQARRSGDWDKAYRLLVDEDMSAPYSAKGYKTYPLFEELTQLPVYKSQPKFRQSSFVAAVAFFYDVASVSQITFDDYGVDPAHANIVLAHFQNADMDAPQTLRIVTARDPKTGAVKLVPMATIKLADPYLAGLMEKNAAQMLSQHHMKLIAIGIIEYVQDNDEHFPDARHWMDQILPYIKSEAVLHDPSAPAGEKYSYAFNRTLSRRTISELRDPAKTLMIFESRANKRNASDLGASRPKPGRHNKGSDYGRADGHVFWAADSQPFPSYKL